MLLLYIALSGGISGLVNNMKQAPNPTSTKIQKERDSTVSSINKSFDEISKFEKIKYYETSTHDQCYKGASGFKRVSGYAYRCSYRITKYYGFSSDFRETMIEFEKHISNLGWRPPVYEDSPTPMKDIMDESYAYEAKNNEGKLSYNGSIVFSGLRTPQPYENDRASLDMTVSEVGVNSVRSLEYAQSVSSDSYDDIYDEKNFQNIEGLFNEITQENTYIFAISIQKDYFRN